MKSLIIATVCLLAASSYAQQDPAVTMFWNNYTRFNPAMAGVLYKHEGTLMARNQWTGFSGNPTSYFAAYNAKVDPLYGGIGVNMEHTDIGLQVVNKAMLNYSFHINVGEETVIAIGASAGVSTSKTDVSLYIFPDGGEEISDKPSAAFNSSFGAAIKFRDLNAGVSVTNLNEPRYGNGWYNYDPVRHYYAFAEYELGISENVALKPAGLFVTDLNVNELNVNVRGILKNKYWFGAGYRTNNALSVMVGWDIFERYRVGYTYEYWSNRIGNGSSSTHELVLGIRIK